MLTIGEASPDLGSSPASFAIHSVRAVLPGRLIDDAMIVVDHGTITDVVERPSAVPVGALDGHGRFCLAGLVDASTIVLDASIVDTDPELDAQTLRPAEDRLRAAGVTTAFHDVPFADGTAADPAIYRAPRLCRMVEARTTGATVDHRLRYRLALDDADLLGALAAELSGSTGSRLPTVSYESGTARLVRGEGRVGRWGQFEATAVGPIRSNTVRALDWLSDRAAAGLIALAVRHPISSADIDDAVDRSVSVAEFPVTLDAAKRSKERGLQTVFRAVDLVRGGDHPASASTRKSIERGWCDALVGGDKPTALLDAVHALVGRGLCTLPEAVRLVTQGPARAVGLDDRGRLVEGARGDLLLVDFVDPFPVVRRVVGAGDPTVGIPSRPAVRAHA